MRYTLLLRALISIKPKDKAQAYLGRLFPEFAAKIDGRYWKDNSLWEASLRREIEYSDDNTALWETLTYLRRAAPNWTIVSGPNDASFDVVVAGIFNGPNDTGLAWCSFEVLRECALAAPASAIDV